MSRGQSAGEYRVKLKRGSSQPSQWLNGKHPSDINSDGKMTAKKIFKAC